MCLVAFALDPDGPVPVVVAANRDEATERAAAPLARWPEGFVAGRDLDAGGTWMGVAPGGRWALVTNVRDRAALADVRAGRRAPRSRGALPVAFLAGTEAPAAFAAAAHAARDAYGAFNLLVGQGADVWFAGAREPSPRPVSPGLHGLSNATLDTPWPKLVRTRDRLGAALAAGVGTDDALLALLDDTTGAPDDALPDTGIGREWERLLAAPRIVSDGYGTRVSTALRIAADGTAHVAERTWHPDGTPGAVVRLRV